MDNEKKIEIPFGAFDSELIHQEINIPNGFKAVIDGNKIILTRAGSEDEQIRKELTKHLKEGVEGYMPAGDSSDYRRWLDWLEKQDKSSDQIHYWTEEEIESIISDYLRGAEHYGGMIARLRCLKPKSLEKQDEQKPFDYENANIQQKDWAEIPFGTKDSELQEATYIIPEGFHAEIRGNEVFIKKGEQKPAWSVEDTFKVQRICKYLDEAKKYYADITEVRDCIEWLKSLKQRN